jgi:hypothetical protein
MERDCSEELGIDGKIILKCILQKYDRSVCVDCIYLDRDTDKLVAGFCEGSNEPSDNKIRGISRIAKALSDSQKNTVPMALVSYL